MIKKIIFILLSTVLVSCTQGQISKNTPSSGLYMYMNGGGDYGPADIQEMIVLGIRPNFEYCVIVELKNDHYKRRGSYKYSGNNIKLDTGSTLVKKGKYYELNNKYTMFYLDNASDKDVQELCDPII